MQITILNVAAKPQQFFEKKKSIIVQSQISELWSQRGKSTYIGPCGFWNQGENPPRKKPRGKCVPQRRRGGSRNAEHIVWVHDVLSSGPKAPVGLKLPLRDLMTGSCFICLTYSQRGWWADQLVSFGEVTRFALLPFSMQGTLSVSIPGKKKRNDQNILQMIHCR